VLALRAGGCAAGTPMRDILPRIAQADAIAEAIAESHLKAVVFSSHTNHSQRVEDEVGLLSNGDSHYSIAIRGCATVWLVRAPSSRWTVLALTPPLERVRTPVIGG
jgi:hypothetical protein